MPKKIKPAEETVETQIYCGPSIPGVASHGMLFTKLPPPLAESIGKCPAVESFVVDVSEYLRIKRASEQHGSFLYTQRQQVLSWLNGGQKE